MIEKTVRFCNLAAEARREYGVVTVPFRRGEWFGAAEAVSLATKKDLRPFSIRPFGAKYFDGSYRFGQAYCPLTINAYQEQNIKINVDETSTARPAPTIPPILLPINFHPPISIIDATGAKAVSDFAVHQVEANAARSVLRIKYRLGHFVVSAYVYMYKDQSCYPFEIRVTGSDPSVTDLSYNAEHILFSIPGAIVSIYGAERRGAQRIDLSSYSLARNEIFGDGQSQCWYGNAYFGVIPDISFNVYAAEVNPLVGISLDWRDSGAYGPFGKVPDALTENESEKFQYAARKYSEFYSFRTSVGNIWDDLPLGLTKNPGATGDQRDFGMIGGWDALDSGRPELLEIYRFNALEDSMRPGHYCELNGDPVTHRAHPNWVSWSGATHWHPAISPDKLGKTGVANGMVLNSWLGKDNEHWSSNLLATAGLLTNSYQLVDELNTEAELFLSSHTLPSMRPGWSTNSMGPARAVGRVYNAMAQNYLITGRTDIAERVEARTRECVAAQWAGKNTSPVRPLKTIAADGRQLPDHPAWLPWQEALGIPGLEAWHQVTGLPIYREIAVAAAQSMVLFGWQIRRGDGGQILRYCVGNAVRWYEDGTPILEEQYFDTTRTYFNAADGMQAWTVTTLKILAEKYDGIASPGSVELAAELLRLITTGRSGPYDRMGEWLV